MLNVVAAEVTYSAPQGETNATTSPPDVEEMDVDMVTYINDIIPEKTADQNLFLETEADLGAKAGVVNKFRKKKREDLLGGDIINLEISMLTVYAAPVQRELGTSRQRAKIVWEIVF